MILKLLWAGVFLATSAGVGAWSVRLPEEPTPAERFAAEELETYLKRAVAGEILREGEAVEFIIRESAGEEPEAWQVTAEGARVYLTGGGARGALYAVYHFLESQIGVRWWTPWVETLEHYQTLTLGEIDASGRPFFAMREICRGSWREFRDNDGKWSIRRRLNSNNDDGPLGGSLGGNRAYGRPNGVHTFDHYLNAESNLSSHPELFSEVDGRRIGGQMVGQLCLSNPETGEKVRNRLLEYIRYDREEALRNGSSIPLIYDISINDNGNYCRCTECIAALNGGNQTDLLLDFVNAAAESIRDEFPEVLISTLAYLYTEELPLRTRPAENVVIRLCDTATNPAFGFDVPENRAFVDKLQAWSQLTDQLSVWDYSVTYDRTLPYPHETVLPEVMRVYADAGVKYFFWEHEFADFADMWELTVYLETKLMEDPYADAEALSREFLTGYYGPAAPEIARYRQALRTAVTEIHPYLHWFAAPPLFDHLNLENLQHFSAILDSASERVSGNPELEIRVDQVRMGVDRAILLRWGILAQEHFAQGGTVENFPFQQEPLRQRIRKSWERTLQRVSDEARATALQRIAVELDIYGTMPLSPGCPPDGLPSGNGVVLLSAPTFRLGAHSFVTDTDAYGGVAVMAEYTAGDPVGVHSVVDGVALIEPIELPEATIREEYQWFRLGETRLRQLPLVYALKWMLQVPLDRAIARAEESPEILERVFAVWVRVKICSGYIYFDSVALVPEL